MPILEEIRETGARSRNEARVALASRTSESPAIPAFLEDVDRHFDEMGNLLAVGRGGLGARNRLLLERGISGLTRSTAALLFHLRLLSGTRTDSSLPLEIAEVFNLGSNAGQSERRFLAGTLLVDDPAFAWPISIEALRGAVAGLVAFLGFDTPTLELITHENGATLSLRPESAGQVGRVYPIQLERTAPLASTPAVVRAVLSRYSVRLSDGSTELEFIHSRS